MTHFPSHFSHSRPETRQDKITTSLPPLSLSLSILTNSNASLFSAKDQVGMMLGHIWSLLVGLEE